jgi:3-deoxy-D-manno-octulosonic acid kinase
LGALRFYRLSLKDAPKDAFNRMTNGGQRIATATGVMLADPAALGGPLPGSPESLFDPKVWAARGEFAAVTGGRGAAWFIGTGAHQWVLRHYRRGGLTAQFFKDRYLWRGENSVRAFAEWRLLAHLSQRGLPVPTPIAAWYRRTSWSYRCDLITRRILDARPLSALLSASPLPESLWRAIGAVIARLHSAGVDHVDLTAHNILLDPKDNVSVVDFDRGRLRAPGTWTSRNLRRLHRSLAKISRSMPADRFTAAAWESFLVGYREAG